jgi:cell filamentation protein
MTSSDREKLEADLTFARTAELFVDPVQGSFDAAHLKEVNRRIFQDLPAAGFDDVTPGVFRPAVDGQDWLKARGVTPKGQVFVAYSRMDIAAISRLDAALRTPLLTVLRDAQPGEAAKALAGLYAELAGLCGPS